MKRAFTLIELLAVIIILAVIALIATPVVLKVVDNAKESARKSSVSGYADTVRLAIVEKQFETGNNPNVNQPFLDNLSYQGEKVSCSEIINSSKYGVVLHDCNVGDNTTKYCFATGKVYDCNDGKYKDIYNQEHVVLVETDASCFEYEEQEIIKSYDVDVTKCINYFSSIFGSEAAVPICNGETYMGITLDTLLLDLPAGAFNALTESNTIYNIVKENIIEIKDYLCGKRYDESENPTYGTEMNPVIPSKINGQEVKNIGYQAFYNQSLTSVIIPNSILIIGDAAFSRNKLTNINLSNLNNIAFISPGAFSCNGITTDNFIGIKEYQYNYFNFECQSPE